MEAVLEQLRAALEAGGYAFAEGGVGGVPSAQGVRAGLTAAGLDPSDDVVAWFAWVGARGAVGEVLPGWAPLGFGDALERRALHLQVERQVRGDAADDAPYGSSVPLLAEPVGGGDLVAVADRGRGAVVSVSQVDGPDGVPVLFDSVEAMARTLVRAWRSGGFGSAPGGVVVADAAALERAWRATNPEAAVSGGLPRVLGPAVTEEPTAPATGRLGRAIGRLRRPRDGADELVARVRDVRRDGDDRLRALEALTKHHPEAAATVLVELVRADDLRVAALEQLAAVRHPEALPLALDVLARGPRRQHQGAIGVLGDLGDRAAVPALLGVVTGDPSPTLVGSAALALGELGAAEAGPVLQGLLDHADAGVRRSARTALDRLDRLDPAG